MSRVTVVDHPLVRHKLAHLRDRNTRHFVFRELVKELSHIMMYEATKDLRTETAEVDTPLERAAAETLADHVVIVPVLRAGLGMLDGCLALVPDASVGFAGMYRDEETLEPIEYYLKIPDVKDSRVYVVDPMLATGGSLSATVKRVKGLGDGKITAICLLASPEGIARMQSDHPDVDIFCASIDRELDAKGYILPGIGDCGDRMFGTM